PALAAGRQASWASRGLQSVGQCGRCGYLSSQPLCKACVLLEGLNRPLWVQARPSAQLAA
ncbi:cytoplasmic tRNA adenylyltransferase 1, partial [Haematococcus lacustris]